jgi:hypothetical protein
MSFNSKTNQNSTLADTGVKFVGYAALLYLAYKIIGLILFIMVMLFLFTLPKNDPVKIALAKEGIKTENDNYIG